MFNKTVTAVLILAITFAGLGFKACSQSAKDRNVAIARDIAASLRSALPIIAKKSPAAAAKLQTAINDADELVTAVANSNQSDIVALVRDILPTFTSIVNEFVNDTNVLIALALAQIGLNFFVDHFVKIAPLAAQQGGRGAEAARDIADFKALPQFGCQYKPEKCK